MAFDVAKYPRGSSLWKNITVSPSSSWRSSDPVFFFVLRHCKSEDQIVQSPTQRSTIQSTKSAHPTLNRPIDQIVSLFYLYSSELQIVPLQICSSSVLLQIVLPLFFRYVLFQVQKSSLRNSVLLFKTQVYKTRDLYGIILPTHQVGIESLTLDF